MEKEKLDDLQVELQYKREGFLSLVNKRYNTLFPAIDLKKPSYSKLLGVQPDVPDRPQLDVERGGQGPLLAGDHQVHDTLHKQVPSQLAAAGKCRLNII